MYLFTWHCDLNVFLDLIFKSLTFMGIETKPILTKSHYLNIQDVIQKIYDDFCWIHTQHPPLVCGFGSLIVGHYTIPWMLIIQMYSIQQYLSGRPGNRLSLCGWQVFQERRTSSQWFTFIAWCMVRLLTLKQSVCCRKNRTCNIPSESSWTTAGNGHINIFTVASLLY